MNQMRINIKPEILFEDDSCLIVYKEPEELTVPGRGSEKSDCLMSRTERHCGSVFNVHRLDQPTSGLVLIARTKEMQKQMSRLFQERKVEKQYVAIVEGHMAEGKQIIDLPLRADIDNRPMQIVDGELGKRAVTSCEVLEVLQGNTRVLLKPETGRTHQLRLHLSSIGYPIVGDRLYNDSVPEDLMGKLKLHALSLKFEHPLTGELIFVSKEAPF